MKTSILLTVLAGLAASAFAAPAPVASASEYPEGTVVEKYPTGLPKHLIPRALGLEKRANAGVYLCNDRNFAGYCVHIVAPMYQCGMSSSLQLLIPGPAEDTRETCADSLSSPDAVPLGGDLNDQVSSVGPDSPNYCFFFRYAPLICLPLTQYNTSS